MTDGPVCKHCGERIELAPSKEVPELKWRHVDKTGWRYCCETQQDYFRKVEPADKENT